VCVRRVFLFVILTWASRPPRLVVVFFSTSLLVACHFPFLRSITLGLEWLEYDAELPNPLPALTSGGCSRLRKGDTAMLMSVANVPFLVPFPNSDLRW